MGKVLIVYASQNGSTQRVAEKIKSEFEKSGFTVDMFKPRFAAKVSYDDYDIIGFGCPTYIMRPSYEILNYLDTLKSLKSRKVFTFVTYGTVIADGANWLRKKARKLGAVDVGHFSCTGRDLFHGYTDRGYLFSPDSPTNAELAEVEPFVKGIIANAAAKVTPPPVPYDPRSNFIYRFENWATNPFFTKLIYSQGFKIDASKCIGCDNCVRNCPTENIKKICENQRVWGRNCIICTMCKLSCPTEAISSPCSWLMFAPFYSYNIRKAVEKGTPYIEVPKKHR